MHVHRFGQTLISSHIAEWMTHVSRQAVGLVASIGLAYLASTAAYATQTEPTVVPEQDCDVIVIGAGGAGLSSAVSAAENGAKVIVVEKMPFIGGNTVLAASFMLGIPKDNRIEAERLESDMIREGGRTLDATLMKRVVTESDDVVNWLREHGANLEAFCLTRDQNMKASCRADDGDGTISRRGIQPANGGYIGEEIIKALLHGIDVHRIPIQTHSSVQSISLNKEGCVSGVVIENVEGEKRHLKAPAVIIATGGFCANEGMITQFTKDTEGLQTTNSPAATGDGIRMAETLGAETIDMNAVTIHPTTLPFSGLIIPRLARVNGAILVNDEGERFADELAPDLSTQIQTKNHGRAWLILDQALLDSMPVLASYARSGYFIRGNSDLELARGIRVPAHKFRETLQRYRNFVDLEKDGDFKRRVLTSRLDHAPLYAVSVRPGIHTSLGGLRVDNESRVLTKHGAIPGLYAAGEVTGGILGKSRLEGAGLTSALVYGRIAGQEAAAWVKTHPITAATMKDTTTEPQKVPIPASAVAP